MLFKKLKALQAPQDDKVLLEHLESLRRELRDTTSQARQETQLNINKIDERIARGLQHSSETIQKQFSESSKLIQAVTGQLTKLDETNKQVLNFSEKMQSLENILKNPKQRGILGEYFLETLLSQVLQPNQYQMQYKFSNGEIVDAIVHFQGKVIPIDAKFSLEKYNKIMEAQEQTERDRLEKSFKMDIKNRIDETAKYIRPNEDTTDFAFMFIPAEGIYYNLLIYKVGSLDINSNDLIEYAFKKHVIIVSPTSFFAYLQTVLQGLKALKMEESIRDIVKNVTILHQHLGSYDSYMQKLGNNLGTTVNMYNSAYKEFKKIDKDVHRITEGASGGDIEAAYIDKPTAQQQD
ncbi:DNA recombination protein RmuC [Candidatus Peregrinibacteria bacterium HGW-Peregrinibacteria-1]|nr:MAG: DNA recombination protein RmuC [Candidatus Peregrinibacteria bacterium HGW-Peregrinibacteria-1]